MYLCYYKKIMKKILLAGVIIIFLFNANLVYAQKSNFLPIVQCELGSSGNPCNLCEAFGIIDRFISLILYYIIPPLAVVAFLMAGIFFLFGAGNPAQITKGRKILSVTIFGILIAYSGWLIVNTVIHQLIGDKAWPWQGKWYQVPGCATEGAPKRPPEYKPPITTKPKKPKPAEGTYSDKEARVRLSAARINVNKENCQDLYNDTNCTSLDGIPKSTIDKLIAIKNGCGCDIMINAGTDKASHKKGTRHGPGNPVTDIALDDARIATADYIYNNREKLGVTKICAISQDAKYRLNCNTNEKVRHLHVEF